MLFASFVSHAFQCHAGRADTKSVDGILGEEPQSPESGEVEDEKATPVTLQFGAAARAARMIGHCRFGSRVCVMSSPPAFVKGQCRAAMRFALVEVTEQVQPGMIWRQRVRGSCSYCCHDFCCTRLMPAFRVSTGLHVKHRRPKAIDASHEGLGF